MARTENVETHDPAAPREVGTDDLEDFSEFAPDVFQRGCSSRQTLEIVAAKWGVLARPCATGPCASTRCAARSTA